MPQQRATRKEWLQMNENPYEELKGLTRQRADLIWKAAQMDEPLSDEDARLVQAMRDHPEYADLWGRLGELSDEQIQRDGTNPILHITIHQTLENQIAIGKPKETTQTVEALMQQGLSRHEAIHRVGTVLAEEIFHILKHERPFDEAGFVRKLQRLVKPAMPHPPTTSRPRRRLKGRYR
jgi:hypothetical protein